MSDKPNLRICVIGAGPAGLAAAHFLKKRGYTRVTVLEKLDRVGGMCSSFTFDSQSFDMGANYLTSSYTQVRKLAKEVGADLYTEGPMRTFNPEERTFQSMRKTVLEGQSFWGLALQSARYMLLRWRLYSVLSPNRPGFARVNEHPELMQSFGAWLDANHLSGLRKAFSIPISLFSYGKLDEVRAAYAMTYMTLGSFFNLAWIMTGLPRFWPKRLTLGFQRLWEKVAWGLDVRLGSRIECIERGETVKVTYHSRSQILDHQQSTKQVLEFDRLILACPMTPDVLTDLLGDNQSETERELSEKVVLNPCAIAAYDSTGLEEVSSISYVLPEPQASYPTVVARQFADNDLTMFFTPYADSLLDKSILLKNMRETATLMGGQLHEEYVHYDRWPYFPHVNEEDFKNGYYNRFEDLQGVNNTYYTNGLLSFELVESVTAYSRQLVERNFADRTPKYTGTVVWLLVVSAVLSCLALLKFYSAS